MVEVIKVIDLTDVPIHMKEILFAKVLDINAAESLRYSRLRRCSMWRCRMSETTACCWSAS